MSATALEAALNKPELFSELQKDFPRGASFSALVANLVRQIVFILQDAIRDADLRLRLRLEPALEPPGLGYNAPPKPPRRLVVKDGDCQWRVEIECHEFAAIIGERVIATGGRDDAVSRVSQEIIHAILRVLNNA